jgi:serine/threonine-protein kinase
VDALSLVRASVPAEKQPVLEEGLKTWPPSTGGRVDPRLIAWLREQGALSVRGLIEAVSDFPVVPDADGASGRRYRDLTELGRGAMGVVQLVEDATLHRFVARKSLDPRKLDQDGMRARFKHEALITAQLDHPCIVPVYDLGPGGDGSPSYTMKLVRGKTLKELLAEAVAAEKVGRPSPEGFDLPGRLSVFLDVCDAMSYAHRRGIIHRDLKPENIMVGAFHQVLVMDWGIAKPIGTPEAPIDALEATGESHATALGTAIGTPTYMSPEQARGENDRLEGRSDQYSLGLILFELVCLQRGRPGRTAIDTLVKAMDGELHPLRHVARGRVPPELAAVIAKATSLRPEDRYPDVDALALDVRRYLRDEPVSARPDTAVQALGRRVARNRNATLALVFGLTAALGFLALIGVVAAVVVDQWNREVAAQRAAALGRVESSVEVQARKIQDTLLHTEGLLRGVASATEFAILSQDAPPTTPYLASAYTTAPPPDHVEGTPWGGKVSLDHVDLALAQSLDPTVLDAHLRRLAALAPVYRRTMLASAGQADLPDLQGDKLLLDGGAPLVWVYAATEQGVAVGYPGSGFYPDGYDPRQRPWYQVALGTGKPTWSALDTDEGGLGLLLTCSVELKGHRGERLGVAAVDYTFGHVIDHLLEPQGLPDGVEAWLVDEKGHVIVRSSQKEVSRQAAPGWTPPPFPDPGLWEQVRGAPSGFAEQPLAGVPTLAVWRPVDAVGWTYLVTGPAKSLFAP